MYIPRIPCAWMAAALWAVASSAAHAQWTIDYTVRYEAAGQQTGKPGEPRGPDTLVSEKITWRVQQEVRGTLNYTQKVRGAVASNMPDKNNEQRYDSWISRSGRAGNPASLKLDAEEVMDSAARLARPMAKARASSTASVPASSAASNTCARASPWPPRGPARRS